MIRRSLIANVSKDDFITLLGIDGRNTTPAIIARSFMSKINCGFGKLTSLWVMT